MTDQQERKQHIRAFMQAHYADERLAQLLAHAQDGKLAFNSCCCFVGIAFWPGDHPLALAGERNGEINPVHNLDGKYAQGGKEAEHSYSGLMIPGKPEIDLDVKLRRIIIPMIRAEMRRRERARAVRLVIQAEVQRVAEPV